MLLVEKVTFHMFLLLIVMLDRPCSEVEWKITGYPLHSPFSPSLPLQCVTMCHQISTVHRQMVNIHTLAFYSS